MLCICSNIKKLIFSENTFYKLLISLFPVMTTFVIIAEAHSWNENNGIWTKNLESIHVGEWCKHLLTREV